MKVPSYERAFMPILHYEQSLHILDDNSIY